MTGVCEFLFIWFWLHIIVYGKRVSIGYINHIALITVIFHAYKIINTDTNLSHAL